MMDACVVWDQRFTRYDFGPGHPMHPIRLELTHRLLADLGALEGAEIRTVGVEPAPEAEVRRVHTAEFVDAVKHLSEHPGRADGSFGIGTDDTPAFAGMHEATSTAIAGTLAAVEAVWSGQASHGVNISGGLHHAMADRAGGFCVYNDIAVGIDWLLENGATRVLYLDIDVHHGDGVERIFYDDPRVITVSLHETGLSLYPGTGFPSDTGGPQAPDTAVNLALPPGTGDEGWLRAFRSVVPALVRAVQPDIIVSQHGCDAHISDPLSHLAVSIDAMVAAYAEIHELAHEVCAGRWVCLGGGGYELIDVVPRAWAHLTAIAAHRPIALDAPVPQAWRDHVQRRFGRPGPMRMGDRPHDPPHADAVGNGHDPDNEVDRAIMATRRAVFPGWGLDPYFG